MKFLYSIIFYLLFSTAYTAERQLQCKVVSISDGDTLTCLLNKAQIKVRLQYIDAPEQAQAYGSKAKQTLANFIFSKNVTLTIYGYDRYQRMLAVVYYNNENINLKLVESGMAWAYTTKKEYNNAQQQAQSRKIGLWQDYSPVNPSEWRKIHNQLPQQAVKKAKNFANASSIVNCQTKLSCNKIGDFELAKLYFQQCGWKELDGNNDSIPCNKLYRKQNLNHR